tara:strand:- start:925 stop:1773 length:849 start_codon:yes stop_codon:yes gene_type:complete
MSTFLLILGLVVAIYFLIKLRGWASKNKIIGNDQPQLSETKKKKKHQGVVKGLADYIVKGKVPSATFMAIATKAQKDFVTGLKKKNEKDEIEVGILNILNDKKHFKSLNKGLKSELNEIANDLSNAETPFDQAIILRKEILLATKVLAPNYAIVYSTDEQISSAYSSGAVGAENFQNEEDWWGHRFLEITHDRWMLFILRYCSSELFNDYSPNDYSVAYKNVYYEQWKVVVRELDSIDDTVKALLATTKYQFYVSKLEEIEKNALEGQMIDYGNFDDFQNLT